MGNLVKSQKEIQRNLDQSMEYSYLVMSSQVQESPNVLIKQSKSGNVEIIKLNMQITSAEISYESTDKIQVELTLSSNRNFSMIAYTFITETKLTKQPRYDRSMQQSTTKTFKCPAGTHFQFPPQHLEFMIVDLLKFQKLKVNPEAQYHNLVIEMKALKPSNVSIIYFYRIDCDENNYHCQLHPSKEIVVFNNRIYEIHELFGIKNTPFNPVWNPNTIEDKECVICFFNMINTVLLPCKHMCTCSVCADHIIMNQKIRQCPLCRIDLDNYLTLEIKDKARKDEQQRQFQVEQQKYYDAIKEKKQEQALKQSSIMEQLQSKVKENQEAERQRQEEARKLQIIEGIDDFNENHVNYNYADEASVESNEEPENADNYENQENQFNNAPSGKLEQISEEEANRHSLEDDKQKYSANQRSSYDGKPEKTSITSAKLQQQSENQKLFKSHSLKFSDSPIQNTNPFDFIDEQAQHRRSLQQPIILQQQQQQQQQQQNQSPKYIHQEFPSFNQQQFLFDSYDQTSNQFEHSSQAKENFNKSVDFSQHSKEINNHKKMNSMNLDLIDIYIDQPQLKQEIKNKDIQKDFEELFVHKEEQVNFQEEKQEQKSLEQEQGVQGQVTHNQQQCDQVSLIVFD